MEFGMPIEEALKLVKEMLETMSDEELIERADLLVNNLTTVLNSPEMATATEEVFKQIDLEGEPPQMVIQNFNAAQEAVFMAIEELKQDYPDSPAKQAFCDMLASVIETYFMNIIGKLANRDSVNIGVELVHENAKIPTYAHEGDQGADIYAVEEIVVEPHTYGNVIPTGLKVIIPHDWCLSIRPRSGLSKNSTLRISNSPATIDQQYRGEIKVLIDNIGDSPVTIKAGERIAQMILERNYQAKYHKVDSVEPDTERGEGGFGSSGN